MSSYDLPLLVLTQDADLTRAADDGELVQLLVADAERALQREREAIRRREGGAERGERRG